MAAVNIRCLPTLQFYDSWALGLIQHGSSCALIFNSAKGVRQEGIVLKAHIHKHFIHIGSLSPHLMTHLHVDKQYAFPPLFIR